MCLHEKRKKATVSYLEECFLFGSHNLTLSTGFNLVFLCTIPKFEMGCQCICIDKILACFHPEVWECLSSTH